MWTILLHASTFDVGSTGDSGPFATFVAAARFLQRGISSSLSSLSSEDMEHGRATSSGSNGTRAAIAEGGLTRVIFFVGCSGSRVNGVRHADARLLGDSHSGCAMEPKTLHINFFSSYDTPSKQADGTNRTHRQRRTTSTRYAFALATTGPGVATSETRPSRLRGSHKRDGCSPTRQALPHHGRAPSACEQMCRRGRCRAAPRSAGRPMGATRQSARPGPAHEARRASSLLGSARNAPSLSSCRSARTPPPPL